MLEVVYAFIEIALFLLGSIVPRRSNIWVVGGGRGLRYADNSMHFFRFCQKATNCRVIWLTHSRDVLDEVRREGYEAYLILSIRGIWFGLSAGWHIFDVGAADTGPTFRGSRHLNLWHGVPLKDISRAKRSKAALSPLRKHLRRITERQSLEFLVHPNHKHASHVTLPLSVPAENVLLANLPRNDVLLREEFALTDHKFSDMTSARRIQELREQSYTIIGYFPTWRSDGEDKFLGASQLSEIVELNSLLEQHKLILVTKWHTCSYEEYNHVGQSTHARRLDEVISSQPNILALNFHSDLNPFLTLCDVLITDYSSVLFDFLLTGRPQYFVPYDLEQYREQSGLLFDYETFVPGPIVYDIPALLSKISAVRCNPSLDTYASRRIELRKEFFEEECGSKRIVSLMESNRRYKF